MRRILKKQEPKSTIPLLRRLNLRCSGFFPTKGLRANSAILPRQCGRHSLIVKAREVQKTIRQLENQIESNNVRLRRTRAMLNVVTEHLRTTGDAAVPKEKPQA
jgi:hypothetical protein